MKKPYIWEEAMIEIVATQLVINALHTRTITLSSLHKWCKQPQWIRGINMCIKALPLQAANELCQGCTNTQQLLHPAQFCLICLACLIFCLFDLFGLFDDKIRTIAEFEILPTQPVHIKCWLYLSFSFQFKFVLFIGTFGQNQTDIEKEANMLQQLRMIILLLIIATCTC